MTKILTFLATAIVAKPEAVKVSLSDTDGIQNLVLSVDQDDMKIVIGKQGQTIRAIRHLLRLKALKEGKRVNLTLEEKTTDQNQ